MFWGGDRPAAGEKGDAAWQVLRTNGSGERPLQPLAPLDQVSAHAGIFFFFYDSGMNFVTSAVGRQRPMYSHSLEKPSPPLICEISYALHGTMTTVTLETREH